MLRPFRDPEFVSAVCSRCGGFGKTVCGVCEGGKKSRAGRRLVLRCTACDPGGLVPCPLCSA